MTIGYTFGYANTNTEHRFIGVLPAFSGGIADVGDLVAKVSEASEKKIAEVADASKKILQ